MHNLYDVVNFFQKEYTKEYLFLKWLYWVIGDEKSKQFYLGGSRHFHQLDCDNIIVYQETDYDFNISNETYLDVIDLLKEEGFIHCDMKNNSSESVLDYFETDSECEFIIKHPELNIQFVVRRNLALYVDVFNSLDVNFWKDYLWKSNKSREITREQIRNIINQLFKTAKYIIVCNTKGN